MKSTESWLAGMRSALESAAFTAAKESSFEETHRKILSCLVLLDELEGEKSELPTVPDIQQSVSATYRKRDRAKSSENDNDEVKKVSKRLKLWAGRPHQINSRILKAFLNLERSGIPVVTEKKLAEEFADDGAFYSNYAQMKAIASNNHGKVFEQYGEKVTLWGPVVPFVREFEKYVFGEQ